MKELLIILGALVLIVTGPFLTIWALDTLFPALNIPYNIETWFAVLLLLPIFGNFRSNKKD